MCGHFHPIPREHDAHQGELRRVELYLLENPDPLVMILWDDTVVNPFLPGQFWSHISSSDFQHVKIKGTSSATKNITCLGLSAIPGLMPLFTKSPEKVAGLESMVSPFNFAGFARFLILFYKANTRAAQTYHATSACALMWDSMHLGHQSLMQHQLQSSLVIR